MSLLVIAKLLAQRVHGVLRITFQNTLSKLLVMRAVE
jgi:hypothetical protein